MADIHGFFDSVVDGHAAGWVTNRQDPSERLVVTILVDGSVAGEAVADRLRGDLLDAGYGDGRYAFKIPLPTSLSIGPHVAEACVHGVSLKHSPKPFEWRGIPTPPPSAEGGGFAGSLQPLLVFAHLLKRDATEVTQFALHSILEPEIGAAQQQLDIRGYSTLHGRFAGSEVTIEDVWFTRNNTLRFRITSPSFNPDLRAAAMLLFVQQDGDASAQALSATRHKLSTDGLTFVDVPVANPYMPLLVGAQTAEGRLLGTTLLPFPSLCRGGAHFGEVLAIGEQPCYLACLAGVSDALVREYIGWEDAATGFAIGRIEVDLQGATGAESIFAPTLLGWLSHVGQVRIAPAQAPCPPEDMLRNHLCAALNALPLSDSTRAEITAREEAGPVILRIPADAIPSVSSIVSRRLRAPAGSAGTSYVISEAPGGRPVWSVSLPPLTDELLALQPRDCVTGFPRLIPARDSGPAEWRRSEGRDVPLAIRFLVPPTDHEAAILRPTAPDDPLPILRSSLSEDERDAATVSVLLPSHIGAEAAAVFLGSLALQTLAANVTVVAALRPNEPRRSEALVRDLERFFPARHRAVKINGASLAGEINALARQASGLYLLVVGDPVILQDTRILETLATMMQGRTASASCVLMREGVFRKGTAITFHSGGFYPSHVSFLSAPRLIFTEPNSYAALPYATFPVFGNPFRLTLVRAVVWQEMQGLDAENFPISHYDLDFALRSSQAGYHHLCTSAVTATSTDTRTNREYLDPLAINFLSYNKWGDIFSHSTLLRELRV